MELPFLEKTQVQNVTELMTNYQSEPKFWGFVCRTDILREIWYHSKIKTDGKTYNFN